MRGIGIWETHHKVRAPGPPGPLQLLRLWHWVTEDEFRDCIQTLSGYNTITSTIAMMLVPSLLHWNPPVILVEAEGGPRSTRTTRRERLGDSSQWNFEGVGDLPAPLDGNGNCSPWTKMEYVLNFSNAAKKNLPKRSPHYCHPGDCRTHPDHCEPCSLHRGQILIKPSVSIAPHGPVTQSQTLTKERGGWWSSVGLRQPQNQHHQHQQAQGTLHSCTPIFKSRMLASMSETGLVLVVVMEVMVVVVLVVGVGVWQGAGRQDSFTSSTLKLCFFVSLSIIFVQDIRRGVFPIHQKLEDLICENRVASPISVLLNLSAHGPPRLGRSHRNPST
ncbi:unnamed protein product [Boreogadus saida]